MATTYNDATSGDPRRATLSHAGGNADSSVFDRQDRNGCGALVIVTTVGGTPTVKIDIQGSLDGTTYWNIPYSLVATPTTWAVAQITTTTAATWTYILKELVPWQYLKVVTSANTNVTLGSITVVSH
jgi:hypothetical protein